MALFEFDSEYGSFPSDDTQADVCGATGLSPWPSVTSNDLLRQLVATGLKSETIFYDGGIAGWTRKPDNTISPIQKALEPGECAFAYVPGTTATGHPSRPVLLYPMVPGSLRFDPKPLGGKAIALRLDGSMAAIEVDRHGRATLGGMDYFDPSQPMWGGKPPDVRLPAR